MRGANMGARAFKPGRAGPGRAGPGRPGRVLGRTDLRISQSRAKFDVRADGDVRSAVRCPKPRKICDQKNFDPKILQKFFVKIGHIF